MEWGNEKEALRNRYARASLIITEVVRQLEDEIQKMKERKVPQHLIDQRDLQVENLISYYNAVDEIIQFNRMLVFNLKMENHFLTQLAAHKLALQDLLQYKPTARTVIDQVDQTGVAQVLTEIPKS